MVLRQSPLLSKVVRHHFIRDKTNEFFYTIIKKKQNLKWIEKPMKRKQIVKVRK